MNASALSLNHHPFSSSFCDLGHVTPSVLSISFSVCKNIRLNNQFTGCRGKQMTEGSHANTPSGVSDSESMLNKCHLDLSLP